MPLLHNELLTRIADGWAHACACSQEQNRHEYGGTLHSLQAFAAARSLVEVAPGGDIEALRERVRAAKQAAAEAAARKAAEEAAAAEAARRAEAEAAAAAARAAADAAAAEVAAAVFADRPAPMDMDGSNLVPAGPFAGLGTLADLLEVSLTIRCFCHASISSNGAKRPCKATTALD